MAPSPYSLIQTVILAENFHSFPDLFTIWYWPTSEDYSYYIWHVKDLLRPKYCKYINEKDEDSTLQVSSISTVTENVAPQPCDLKITRIDLLI